MSSTSIHSVLRADRTTFGLAAWRSVADLLLVRLGEGHRMRRTMASLQAIDDRTLKDIGVNRCEIMCLAGTVLQACQNETEPAKPSCLQT